MSSFFGRKHHLQELERIVYSEAGQAVLLVGQQGMGKTALLNRFSKRLSGAPNYQCFPIIYEVDSVDTADALLDLMWNDSFRAAKGREGSFDPTAQRVRQWKAFLDTFGVGDLVKSLMDATTRGTKQRLIERFESISSRMAPDQRAVFLIDPFDTLTEHHASTWGIVVKALPPRFSFVFAQRPNDVLAQDHKLNGLSNVQRITLGPFSDEDLRDVTSTYSSLLGISGLADALDRFAGHPYAVMAAIALLADGTSVGGLPDDPSRIAAAQWKQVCAKGVEFVDVLKAHAILQIAADDNLVSVVTGLPPSAVQTCRSDPFLDGLLTSDNGKDFRIYHDILLNLVRSVLSPDEATIFHKRAAAEMRKRLEEAEDALPSALRLPEHVLQVEGPDAFATCVAKESVPVLLRLWKSDAAERQLRRALESCRKASETEWRLYGHLGIVSQRLGRNDDAVHFLSQAIAGARRDDYGGLTAHYLRHLGKVFRAKAEFEHAAHVYAQSMELSRQLADTSGMAADYSNLGTVLQRQGKWAEAQRMHEEALKLNATIESPTASSAMAINYGCLGVIARALGDLRHAEQMHRKSLALNLEVGNQQGAAVNLNNLGNVLVQLGRLDDAEAAFSESLEINRYLEHVEGIAVTRMYLGRIFLLKRARDTALQHFRHALRLFEKLGNRERVAEIKRYIADL